MRPQASSLAGVVVSMTRRTWDHDGRTAHQRGYGARWQKLRLVILAREPLCRSCRAHGRTRAATIVDHITPKANGGTDDDANLQPLCVACHDAKTIAEKGAKPRGARADGMPTDPSHPWSLALKGDTPSEV